jgi:putative aminopeptidase FrvX
MFNPVRHRKKNVRGKMNDITKEFVEILTDLLEHPSPSGREERTREYIKSKLDEIGFAHETDPAGNLLVRLDGRNSKGPLTIIAAHMDEIAMVVIGIEGNGDLKVINSGGLVPCKLGETAVEILSDKNENVIGLFSMGSAHTKAAREGTWAPGWADVRIKTGLTPEALKEKGVRIGSSAVPVRSSRGPHVFGDEKDPMVSAWTFDDRAGIAELLIVLKMIKYKQLKPENRLVIAFTVHEEGGCHGAKVLAQRERPEIFIAIDGCPVVDPETLKLDGRPGVWSKDSLCHYDQRLVKDLMDAGIAAGTELQPVVYTSASSDASAVYNVGGAARIAFLGHVRTNSHGFELARLSVFQNTVNTLFKFIEGRLCGK